MTKKALGRGLDALISGGMTRPPALEVPRVEVPVQPPSAVAGAVPATAPVSAAAEGVRHLDINVIEPSRYQPRTEFDSEHLKELSESIKQRGVIQPLLVRPVVGKDGQGRFELIAGERRWRAARLAGLTSIPALVREAGDQEVLEIALIENLQREDLNPVEEAKAYAQLVREFRLTQEQIADKVGRNRATVANSLRLLSLPSEVLNWVSNGQLTVGHAKAVLGLVIPEEQRLIAERVLREGLSVRETEQLVERLKGQTKVPMGRTAMVKSPDILAIEEQLQQKLGTQVSLRHGKKKGRIEIRYFGNDELARLLAIFGVENL